MKPRILIVDDDEAITQQLFWTLSDEYDVITANDMQSAVRRATIYEPDISILDLQLPPATTTPEVGLRILDYLKAHLPATKVLVMTSVNSGEVRQVCFDNGADEFFSKPFDTELLISAMRRLTPHSLDFT